MPCIHRTQTCLDNSISGIRSLVGGREDRQIDRRRMAWQGQFMNCPYAGVLATDEMKLCRVPQIPPIRARSRPMKGWS